ncbi:MAG: hypothetical protein Q8L78_09195 [Coxiellaceae bacterium]|nr:hypothetical protein [Coxiellaceae bacterium]
MRLFVKKTQVFNGFLYYPKRAFYGASIFNSEHYTALSENEYARYAPNPPITAYFLVESDSNKSVLEAKQFSFKEIQVASTSKADAVLNVSGDNLRKKIEVPAVEKIFDLSANYDPDIGDIVLQGKTAKGIKMIGNPQCQVGYEPLVGLSKSYTYYAMKPNTHYSKKERIKKFQETTDAKQLQKQKSGKSKDSNPLRIVNKDIPLRAAITTRTPDQNDVMGYRAVDAYLRGQKEYQKIFSSELNQLLMQAGNIMHLSTLRACLRRGQQFTKEEIDAVYRDRLFRPEWLHRHAYVLHAMNEDPQTKNNLASARACDNTLMMLLERVLKWVALHIPESKNNLYGKFDLLLDTEIIEKITLLASCVINQVKFTLKQEINTLIKNPGVISASDLAGLLALLSFLIQNKQPEKVDVIKVCHSLSYPTLFDARYSDAGNVHAAESGLIRRLG